MIAAATSTCEKRDGIGPSAAAAACARPTQKRNGESCEKVDSCSPYRAGEARAERS